MPFDAYVGVIGAGVAGLTAAAQLTAAGRTVLVLEKARGPGGRAATRRDGEDSFDHGAQYFSCRTPEFRELIAALEVTGQVQRWDARVVAVSKNGAVRPSDHERFVGVPGMNALARHFGRNLASRFNTSVTSVRYDAGWHVTTRSGDTLTFAHLLLTTPPSQAAKLLAATSTPLLSQLAAVVMQPCWAVMLSFDEPVAVAFDAAYVDNGGALAWCARDSCKPGRPSGERWVLHATSAWSQAHLEDSADAVSAVLLNAFRRLARTDILTPCKQIAHRWRFAQAPSPRADELPVQCLRDDSMHLTVAGDWCAGSRVEGAYLSGLAAAAAILQQD
jgi:renalase